MGDIAGFAFGQIAPEDFIGVAANPGLHQKTCKVGARDQLGVARVAQRAFVGPGNARFFQQTPHFSGARAAAIAGVVQALCQFCVVGIKAQAHDMHAAACVADGNFSACHIVQTCSLGCCGCAVLAADFIVIGQRPQLHPSRSGTLGQLLGRQSAVGDDRVAVEIGVQIGFGHGFIVGCRIFCVAHLG